MVKTTGKKQQETHKEVIPKGNAFMPKVSYDTLKKAYEDEQPGKPQIILRVCLLRKEDESIHNIARITDQKYPTVRGWLLRMKDGDLSRWFDKKPGRKKQDVDSDIAEVIDGCLDNPPKRYGFTGGTWQLAMVAFMLYKERGISIHTRKIRRILNRMGFSYTKARPVPAKSATPEEPLEFMNETDAPLPTQNAYNHLPTDFGS